MRILIFGGTRFIGKSLVQRLLSKGHKIVCISRKKNTFHTNLISIVAERDEGLNLIKNKNFDFIIDFIGYNANSVYSAMETFKNAHYILISSSWVSQYENKIRTFFSYEERYINEKLEAEKILKKDFIKGYKRSVIRLPITLGQNDHTHRFNYYLWRIIDEKPIICIDNNLMISQITYKEDVINALLKFIRINFAKQNFIYEGLPRETLSQDLIVNRIAKALRINCQINYYSENIIKNNFPEMLNLNPFYRERNYIENYANLFEYTNIDCKKYSEWIPDLALINQSILHRLDYKEKHSKKWYLKAFLNKELKCCE